MPDRDAMLEAAIEASVTAGRFILEHYNDAFRVSRKESLRDIVTDIDKIAEEKVIEALRRFGQGIPIMTEEHGDLGGGGKEYWVVDALDGTVNYVNHIPFFCVSIAYFDCGRPVAGVIYNPMSEDLYYGAEGIGGFKNQGSLKIKDKAFEDCLFSAAFSGKSYDPLTRKDEFQLFGEVNDSSRGCIRTGSAAMNLAYLADGKLGGCWGKANKIWDVAAGLLLARLAGASVEFREVDKNRRLVTYLAAVPSAFEKLKGKILSAAK